MSRQVVQGASRSGVGDTHHQRKIVWAVIAAILLAGTAMLVSRQNRMNGALDTLRNATPPQSVEKSCQEVRNATSPTNRDNASVHRCFVIDADSKSHAEQLSTGVVLNRQFGPSKDNTYTRRSATAIVRVLPDSERRDYSSTTKRRPADGTQVVELTADASYRFSPYLSNR